MLLNHRRQTPAGWDDAEPSLCPDCGAGLVARRGEVVVWHWAHRRQPTRGHDPGCSGHSETRWHLTWKDVQKSFSGWEVEVPVEAGGRAWRADAVGPGGLVVEFVHSLRPSYVEKHLAMSAAGLKVLWVWDGSAFGSARVRDVRGGGVKHLLKPAARKFHARLGGLVHHAGGLWRHWRGDVWFPIRDPGVRESVRRFDRRNGTEGSAFTV